jgi:hypothetical protein
MRVLLGAAATGALKPTAGIEPATPGLQNHFATGAGRRVGHELALSQQILLQPVSVNGAERCGGCMHRVSTLALLQPLPQWPETLSLGFALVELLNERVSP